ncbi:mitochondrial 54S ribosomal protein mL38 SCDLUD_004714 [Saccharomycodes ludwigii]|uniref:mitochondrial 54S ribosomal protein mL38 n=1 Tax=Saccharomycodes ludwigii TaxID=36035 RepID=UPI001E884A6E|nr:hypothetical protein SCDLUD_004714 [Saccharomycodes ludwigii]KAH3899278.1 hypothetical protein SCDLUD_004714 [Saccharomycodes ludwigii]
MLRTSTTALNIKRITANTVTKIIKNNNSTLAGGSLSAASTTGIDKNKSVWNDESRPAALKFKKGSKLEKYFFDTNDSTSLPPSLRSAYYKKKYTSPSKLDETFKLCYKILESKVTSPPTTMGDIATEINNPVVHYNFGFHDKIENNPNYIDYNLPIYRYLGLKHWENENGQMLLMQRLETLHVLPDTLPTLDPAPVIDLKLRFPYVNGSNRYVEPGLKLSSKVTMYPPQFKLINYDPNANTEKKYTIVIINPDEPDLVNDSYKTVLHYALSDITLEDYNKNVFSEFENNGSLKKLLDYLPPTPEKNAGDQRFVIWLFEQQDPSREVKLSSNSRDFFDIRTFAKDNNLKAAGAHVWRSGFDQNVNKVREAYSLPKGKVFTRVRVY